MPNYGHTDKVLAVLRKNTDADGVRVCDIARRAKITYRQAYGAVRNLYEAGRIVSTFVGMYRL